MQEVIGFEIGSTTDEFNPAAPQNRGAVFDHLGPVSSVCQSGSQLGQNGSKCVTENGHKPDFQPENADSVPFEKNVGHLGHSDESEMPDELRKMHAEHPPDSQPFDRHADLSDLQLRTIELTINGHSDSEITRMVRVSRKTLWRWKMRNTTYRQYLNQSRIDRWCMIGLRQQSSIDRAACTLDKLLDNSSETNRVRAALALVRLFGLSRPRK